MFFRARRHVCFPCEEARMFSMRGGMYVSHARRHVCFPVRGGTYVFPCEEARMFSPAS